MKARILAALIGVAAPMAAWAQTTEDLKKDHTTTGDVLVYGMGYWAQRYSTLTQINKGNASRLMPKWAYSLSDNRGSEGFPVVKDGVIYVTAHNMTAAVDALTGKQLWRNNHEWVCVFTKGQPNPPAHRSCFNTWTGAKPQSHEHPTEKPLGLMTYIISAIPKSVNNILDPFAGSGTTLEAAKLLGFNALGIERNPIFAKACAAKCAQDVMALSAKAENQALSQPCKDERENDA